MSHHHHPSTSSSATPTTFDKFASSSSSSSSYDHQCEKHTTTLFDLMHQENKMEQDDVKKKGIAFFSTPKTAPLSLTSCNICFDMLPTSLLLSISKCKHTFCNYCIQKYVMQSFKEGDFIGCELLIKCPEAKCERMIMPIQLKQIIPKDVYKRWKMRRVSLAEYIRRVIKAAEEKDYINNNFASSRKWRRRGGAWCQTSLANMRNKPYPGSALCIQDWNDIDTYAILSQLGCDSRDPTFSFGDLSPNNYLACDTKSKKDN